MGQIRFSKPARVSHSTVSTNLSNQSASSSTAFPSAPVSALSRSVRGIEAPHIPFISGGAAAAANRSDVISIIRKELSQLSGADVVSEDCRHRLAVEIATIFSRHDIDSPQGVRALFSTVKTRDYLRAGLALVLKFLGGFGTVQVALAGAAPFVPVAMAFYLLPLLNWLGSTFATVLADEAVTMSVEKEYYNPPRRGRHLEPGLPHTRRMAFEGALKGPLWLAAGGSTLGDAADFMLPGVISSVPGQIGASQAIRQTATGAAVALAGALMYQGMKPAGQEWLRPLVMQQPATDPELWQEGAPLLSQTDRESIAARLNALQQDCWHAAANTLVGGVGGCLGSLPHAFGSIFAHRKHAMFANLLALTPQMAIQMVSRQALQPDAKLGARFLMRQCEFGLFLSFWSVSESYAWSINNTFAEATGTTSWTGAPVDPQGGAITLQPQPQAINHNAV